MFFVLHDPKAAHDMVVDVYLCLNFRIHNTRFTTDSGDDELLILVVIGIAYECHQRMTKLLVGTGLVKQHVEFQSALFGGETAEMRLLRPIFDFLVCNDVHIFKRPFLQGWKLV